MQLSLSLHLVHWVLRSDKHHFTADRNTTLHWTELQQWQSKFFCFSFSFPSWESKPRRIFHTMFLWWLISGIYPAWHISLSELEKTLSIKAVFISHGCNEQLWQWQSMTMTVKMTPPAPHAPYLALIHSGDSWKCQWAPTAFFQYLMGNWKAIFIAVNGGSNLSCKVIMLYCKKTSYRSLYTQRLSFGLKLLV